MEGILIAALLAASALPCAALESFPPKVEVPALKVSARSNERPVDDVRARIARLLKDSGVSGAAGVYRRGVREPLFEAGFGDGGPREDGGYDARTAFNMASMGKMITAVMILRQVERGRLRLEDTLGARLPDDILRQFGENRARVEKITIQQLLTHTSGLAAFWGPDFDRVKDSLRRHRDYVPILALKPFADPAHVQNGFFYSNNGFIMLGLVLEALEGRDYFELARDFMERSGMTDGGFPEKTSLPAHHAQGYVRGADGTLSSNYDALPLMGSAAGGGSASVSDWRNFADSFLRGRIVSEATARRMTSRQVPMNPSTAYGFGFGVITIEGRSSFGHNGGFPGVATALDMTWDDGLIVIILANREYPPESRGPTDLTLQIARLVAGKP
ncbi:MAG: beta-lactamase family protein [Proteobacteria bacterium]|nr:beta-lactamase family protein [Pseudomonadota bacterium]